MTIVFGEVDFHKAHRHLFTALPPKNLTCPTVIQYNMNSRIMPSQCAHVLFVCVSVCVCVCVCVCVRVLLLWIV